VAPALPDAELRGEAADVGERPVIGLARSWRLLGCVRGHRGLAAREAPSRDAVSVDSARFGVGDHASFGTDYVHDVVFESGSPAVSIHAYSPP